MFATLDYIVSTSVQVCETTATVNSGASVDLWFISVPATAEKLVINYSSAVIEKNSSINIVYKSPESCYEDHWRAE